MSDVRIYVGDRLPGTGASVSVIRGIRATALDARHDIEAAAAEGFEWGYHGSGPRRLAFAILADHMADDKTALDMTAKFAGEVLAGLNKPGFQLTGGEIDQWLESARVPA